MKQLPTLLSQPVTPTSDPIKTERLSESERLERKKLNQAHKAQVHRHAKRPPLDDAERHQTVSAILDGLKSFGTEGGARVATSIYNHDWLEAEPDLVFANMLVTNLLDTFGDSPSANVTLWKKYKSS